MIMIAAVAMFDSRASALPDPTGTFPGGLGPGFYPFWSAAMIAGAALFVIFRSRVIAGEAQGVFEKRESWVAPLKIALPMVVAVGVFHQPQLSALRQSFRNAKTQSSEIRVNKISTSGNTATVDAVRRVNYEPNGAKAGPPVVSDVTLRMEKRNDRWVIVGIR